jgi:hypothetical protein
MIDTKHLKKCTCHIRQDGDMGTGFFVSRDQILTCRHVVPGMAVGDIVNVVSVDGAPFQAGVQAICPESDLAVLLTKEFGSEHMMELYDAEVVRGTEWACHGHPDDPGGQGAGLPLDGVVADQVNDSHDRTHDLTLTAQGVSLSAKYKGYSGSGMIDAEGRVIGIMRYKGTTYLHGVSVRKAAAFLIQEKVSVKPDSLSDFSGLIVEAFGSLEGAIRGICLATGGQVSGKLGPQAIAEKLKGGLFYPTGPATLREVITRLRRNETDNRQLWLGWLKFLTYVAVVRGSYEEVNKVSITIDSTRLSKLLNVDLTPITVRLTLSLNFFFTESQQFFSITGEYLSNRWMNKELKHNSCHVFNSSHGDFGLGGVLTAERKNRIVADITTPSEAGMIVPGKLDFGVISLSELTRQVKQSQTITEATQNLENLFKDALS